MFKKKTHKISDAELLKKLPMFPRKSDGSRLSKRELKSLVEHIRKHLEAKAAREAVQKKEPFFGKNIREAWQVIRSMFKKKDKQ